MSGLISEETLEKIPSLIALLRGRIEDENVRCDDDDARTALALAEDLLEEVRRLREDSKTLNTIGFAAAKALGLVPPGIEMILADPAELVEMLIAKAKQQEEN